MNNGKKLFALLLALCFIIGLMAGCGGATGNTDTSKTNTAATEKPSADAQATKAPVQDDGNTGTDEGNTEPAEESPYNYAVGKYTVNEKGLPSSQYEYTMPLSTTDEVFTWWTTCYVPQYIPEEGYGSMDFRADMMELTGVHLEWDIAPASTMQQNFSILLASDDLRDLSYSAYSFFTGTVEEGLEEWFVNLNDYREYIPNYLYQVTAKDDVDVTSKIFYDDETILAFYCIMANPVQVMGYFVREDWLQNVGMTAEDIKTYEDMEKALVAMQVDGHSGALELNTTLEPLQGVLFAGFDTTLYVSTTALPYCRVVDGKVEFTLTTDDDLAALTMARDWASRGLIYPSLHNASDQNDRVSRITTGKIGYYCIQPGEVKDYVDQSTDPDCSIVAIHRTVKSETEPLKYGQKVSPFQYGASVISKSCENSALLTTFCDWWYSESGSFYFNFGPQGIVWDYDADGNVKLTDFIVNNEAGMSWALSLYAGNGLTDHGLQIFTRKYQFDGGEVIAANHHMWDMENYKGEYDFPNSISYTAEEQEELNVLSGDIVTYLSETMLSFYDGSKPLSEWNEYVQSVNAMGLTRCAQIRQEAYDRFMTRFK